LGPVLSARAAQNLRLICQPVPGRHNGEVGVADDREGYQVMGDSRLGFGLLGPLMMAVAGRPVVLGGPKQRAVLAMLLINRNRAVSTDSLIGAVSDQSPVSTSRASIHTYVSNLRRLLGNGAAGANAVLAVAPPGYRLSVADGECDLDRFIAEKTAGILAAAGGRFDLASSHLSAALTHWRGTVLDDLRDFAFVEPFATALMEDKVLVHTTRAEAEIACGRASAVIGELETLAVSHPYREPVWALLMTAYYVADRQSDALEAFRRLRTVLAEDLGVDPGPTVKALHARILRRERLDTKYSSKATAMRNASASLTASSGPSAVAALLDAAGRRHPLVAASTRIGRLPDNDIVLNDAEVSREHAVIIDTGTNFVIVDLRSANGVLVQHELLRRSATLADGDHIDICGHEFTFENQPR
jgi:SARP family transcriptional regulator, regulator of embCAB operon